VAPPPKRKTPGRGLLAAVACVALAAAGCTTGTPGTSSHPSGQASARPTASSPGTVAACPTTPAAGAAHTLTFPPPASVAGWQYDTSLGVSHGTEEPELSNGTLCQVPVQQVGFFDSQGATALFRAGYHGGTWTTFNSFWGFFFSVSGETVQMVSPGPLGGHDLHLVRHRHRR
jgi:hypothetical protein